MFDWLNHNIKKHKYKILAAVSFLAAGYLFYLSLNDDKNIKLSTFLEALRAGQLDEVVLKGHNIWFRSLTSEWYHSNINN